MAFMKMTKGTLGLFAGIALTAFAAVRGCQEAIKDNPPGVSNTEQFFSGAARAPVDAVKGVANGIFSAFDSGDVKEVLEGAEKAGRSVVEGAGDYMDSKTGTRKYPGPVEPLPDYVPGDTTVSPPEPKN